MRALPCTASALLHPITLTALALWALNDHALKGWGPALLTGKLSDVAALVVCPTVLLGSLEWCRPQLVRRHLRGVLAGCCALFAVFAIGLELSSWVELAYQHVLASAQYAARYLAAGLARRAAPDYVLVQTTADVTDLLALPALAIPWRLVQQLAERPRS